MNKQTFKICRRCGRKLKGEKSIELGFGPICYNKYISQNNHKELFSHNIKKDYKNYRIK